MTVPSPVPTDEDIDEQLDRMREQFATLAEVERPAADGDLVTLDIHGTRDGEPAEGLTADDLVYQVGTGGIVEGIDEQLVGAKVGDIFEMDAEDAPDGPAHLRRRGEAGPREGPARSRRRIRRRCLRVRHDRGAAGGSRHPYGHRSSASRRRWRFARRSPKPSPSS